MSTQLSKRQQQRNEQILQGLLKYCRLHRGSYVENQEIANVLIVVPPIQVGQVTIWVVLPSACKAEALQRNISLRPLCSDPSQNRNAHYQNKVFDSRQMGSRANRSIRPDLGAY